MKHRSTLGLLGLLALVLGTAGCNLDPNKAKVRYVENGDKYYAQGKFKEAILLYRNAIKKDPKYGPAYLKLGDAEAKRGTYREAAAAYRRAVELLSGNDAESAAGKLADIYLVAFSLDPKKNASVLPEVQDLARSILAKNPSSFQGFRLQGFLALTDEKDADRFRKAIEFFKKADSVKPKRPELVFALCQVLNQSGDWPESEAKAKQILADSPEYVPAYDFLVGSYIRRNQLQDAEAVFSRKVEKHPKVYQFAIQKAAFLWSTQRPAEADKILDGLLAREQEFPQVRRAVGDFYHRVRNFDKAYHIFEEGASKDAAKKTDYRLRMAEVLVSQGKSQDAMALVERAVNDDPQNNNALAMRASMQLAYGGPEKANAAISDLQTLIGKTPENAVIRYNLAKAYHNRGDLDAARVQYAEAIKRAPKMTAAHIGAGQVALQKRDFGRAMASAEEVLRYDPKNLAARVIKTNALTNSGNLRQARSDLVAYMAETPDSPDLKFQLAVVDFLDNRFKESEASFRDLYQRYPNDLRLTYAIAELMLRTNRQSEGLKLVQDALAKNPGNRDLKLAVANTALRIDRLDLAEKTLRELTAADGKNPDLYLRLGETLRRKGQMQAAVEALRKARQLAPTSANAALQLAMTLEALGNKSESLPLYEAVVRIEPDNLIALNNIAFSYAEAGRDLELALTYAQRARQRAPNSEDVADTLAWVYIKKSLNDNAVTILREITSRQPRNPTYHYHLGVAMSQKGNKPAAKQSLQTALSLKPSRDEESRIRELLAKLG